MARQKAHSKEIPDGDSGGALEGDSEGDALHHRRRCRR
jgi:hypothetical protein